MTDRQYVNSQILGIYANIINMLPNEPICESCGFRGEGIEGEKEVYLCEGCDKFYCADCVKQHLCTAAQRKV